MDELNRSIKTLNNELKIREARENDLLLIYYWNNDPAVRINSFNSNPITLEDHTRWYEEQLKALHTKIYIVEVAEIPAAQIRFNISGEIAIISYLIASEYRGKGLGHLVLLEGVKQLNQDCINVSQVEGLVQQSNIASIRAFEKAGFQIGTADSRQPEALRFIITLER